MFSSIVKKCSDIKLYLRRKYYSMFMISTLFLTKTRANSGVDVPVFSHVTLTTEDNRTIVFTFKVDTRVFISKWLTKYIVETIIDDSFTPEFKELNNKLLITVTIFIVNADYDVLANILLNKYLQYSYAEIKRNRNEPM